MPPPVHQQPFLRLSDVYYTLFRHKRLILGFILTGVLSAGVFYLKAPKTYISEAKVLIRYVVEQRAVSRDLATGTDVKSPDARGYNILNTELQIITSRDIITNVFSVVPPEKIVTVEVPGTAPAAAAGYIMNNIRVENPVRSSIIRVTFRHSNPDIAQRVLEALVNAYIERHAEIHRQLGTYDEFLRRQTAELKLSLTSAEEDLRKLKAKAGIISLTDTRKAYADQTSRIGQELLMAQTELAGYEATVTGPVTVTNAAVTNTIATTTNAAPTSTNATAMDYADKMNRYRDLCARLSAKENREVEMMATYTDENPQLQTMRVEIAELRKRKQEMVQEFPGLAWISPTTSSATGSDRENNAVRIPVLQARIRELTNQLAQIQTNSLKLDEIEVSYREIERRKEILEANYRAYALGQEQARIADATGAGKVSNIAIVESATPLGLERSKRLGVAGGLLAAGLFGGIILAFLIDLYLDQSVKRPSEFETKLHLPLFLWIPELGKNGKSRAGSLTRLLRAGRPPRKLLPAAAPAASSAAGDAPSCSGGTESQLSGSAGDPPAPSIVSLDEKVETTDPELSPPVEIVGHPEANGLRLYHDALRDRLMMYFESRNMTHKPKLVAITGCGNGSGVSSIASGVAASLSETGDGKVLLVDMNPRQGAAHPFYRGQPVPSLPDALEQPKEAMGDGSFFLASGGASPDGRGEELGRVMPKRFTQLVPKMKASDYDYIIFDMPPVDQVSITPRIAGYMDITLLVVEAEKTPLNMAKRAVSLLGESKAAVGAVLNKQKSYTPKRLHLDI